MFIQYLILCCYLSDEFRSKVACENDAVNLLCYPGKRVAIYSASFGRTEYESLQCPQPHGVKEESKKKKLTIKKSLKLLFYIYK